MAQEAGDATETGPGVHGDWEPTSPLRPTKDVWEAAPAWHRATWRNGHDSGHNRKQAPGEQRQLGDPRHVKSARDQA